MDKMKKLLAWLTVAAIIVCTLVTSAATKVGTITVGTDTITVGETEATVDITLDFGETGVKAPHEMFTLTAPAGFTLTSIAVAEDGVTYAEGSPAEGKVELYSEAQNLAEGKIIIEATIDELKSPTVTKIVATATYAVADTVAVGTYAITVDSQITNYDEAELELEEVDGSIVVEAAHVCTPAEAVKENEKAADCTTDGSYDLVVYCSECKVEISRESFTVDALGHDYDDGVIDPDATCTSEGVNTFTCANCGDKYTEAISAKGHTEVEIPAVDATCTEDGATAGVKCSVCDAVITAPVVVPATGEHNYVDGTCGTCGAADPDYKPECAHTPAEAVKENVVDATFDVAGSCDKVVYCSTCGEELSREAAIIPQVLKFASASLTLESSIAINYKVNYKYFETYGYENPYVIFDVAGVKSEPVTEYKIEGTGSAKRYVFVCPGVKSSMMTEAANAVVYAEYDGEVYASATQEYSVATYCYNQLGKENTTEFKTMLVDLLNYGTEAQLKWSRKLDDLANAKLTDAQKALASTDEALEAKGVTDYLKTDYAVVENATATWKAAALLLEDAVTMRFRFVTDEDVADLSVKITSDSGKEWTIPAEDITWNASAQRYEVLFNKLFSFEMRDCVYATLYKGDVAVSNTIRYSIETYVARNSDASYTDLLTAMLKYGDAAYNHFKK